MGSVHGARHDPPPTTLQQQSAPTLTTAAAAAHEAGGNICELQPSLGCYKEGTKVRQLEYGAYQGTGLTREKCALACAYWCTGHGPHNHNCLAGVEGKKGHECKMLLSTIGVHEFHISAKTINKTIASLRMKFINEFVNYYYMFISYLKEYITMHPSALSVVQADNNGCFYRLMISVPHAKTIFDKMCLPIYFIDGTFSKTGHYDGVLIQVSGKHGFEGFFI